MPLDSTIREQYPDHWPEIRRTLLKRSLGRSPLDRLEHSGLATDVCETIGRHYDGPSESCESCGVPQGERVYRYDGLWTLAVPGLFDMLWFDRRGQPVEGDEEDLPSRLDAQAVEIRLSVAHRCQDPRCDDIDHLLVLCRRCHMRLDYQPTHRHTRKLLYAEFRGQQRLPCCREPGCDRVVGEGR
jgi:hypothetical protein